MAATSNTSLPRVGQTVELWFSGYDGYYAGRVESLEPPDYFNVTLDDGSSWPVDRLNNVWKYPDNPAQSTSDNNADTHPATQRKHEPQLGADDDPAVDTTRPDPTATTTTTTTAATTTPPQHDEDATATGTTTRALATVTKDHVQVDPGAPAPHGKMAEADPHAKTPADQTHDATPKRAAPAQKRRGSGRALRKSTAPSSRAAFLGGNAAAREASGDEGSSSQARAAGKRRGRPPGRGRGDAENGDGGGVEGEAVGARRSARRRSGGGGGGAGAGAGEEEEEEGGVAVLTTRVTRRTRQSGGEGGGVKRGVEEVEVEEDGRVKRRKGGNGGVGVRVLDKVVEKSVVVANGVDKMMGEGNDKGDEGVERLSTQAVTAIAVDAALASAKAVLKPLSDKMKKVSEEMVGIHKEVKEAYEAMVKSRVASTVVGKPLGAEVSQAALDSLLLDLSETIGGGEARIRAYEQMSDMEFEVFRKALQENSKALSELDRLLGDARVEKGKEGGKGATRRGRKL